MPSFFLWGAVIALVSNVICLIYISEFAKFIGNLSFVLPFLGFSILWRLNSNIPESLAGKGILFKIDIKIWYKLSKYLLLHLLAIVSSSILIHKYTSIDQLISSGIPFSFFGFWGSINSYYVFKSLSELKVNES